MKHAIHPEADAEFAQAVRYYAGIDPKLGLRFYNEIERVITAACKHPDRFFRFSPPARRVHARKFPYSVVYLDQPDRVWIVAVMHVKRRPGYWRARL
ncbi:MAG TPA: type II toxin-antitoxin system RelE/ParE family toxin [Candidatus Sulfotelmatobacter sp.]|nr:type II toxin-antitoxin system RelE/ParE family toxin [Candidatus Sulfotelmatobacter sp.]